ncbi:hypothetical protein [Dyadobacter bucti]|uniref:hypothetical protein n=1 Tax=Dyadobacter bucti TaxID=2572203 RepID=UPI001109688C|nr:hypothetical protein [Dyadobacter bucti]
MKQLLLSILLSIFLLISHCSFGQEKGPEFKVIKTGSYSQTLRTTSYCLEIVAQDYNPNSVDHWKALVKYVNEFDPQTKSEATIHFAFYDTWIKTDACSCNFDAGDGCESTYRSNLIASGSISPQINGNRTGSINLNGRYRMDESTGPKPVTTGGVWSVNLKF